MKTLLLAVRAAVAEDGALLQKVIQLARALPARVELFSVVSPLIDDPVAAYAELISDAQRALTDKALAALEAHAQVLRAAGISTTTSVSLDVRTDEAIVRRAKETHADLVVTGCHSPHRLPALLTYTDWELVRSCPVPLLLVKNPALWSNPRVLAAVDPGRSHDKPAQLDVLILRHAALMATRLGGELHVMHALTVPKATHAPLLMPVPQAMEDLRRQAELASKEAFAALVSEAGVSAETHVSSDAPSAAIPELARSLGADLIVMGAVVRSRPERWVLGDTALKVIDHVSSDLLVIKPAADV